MRQRKNEFTVPLDQLLPLSHPCHHPPLLGAAVSVVCLHHLVHSLVCLTDFDLPQ